jgi:hypothetical protein
MKTIIAISFLIATALVSQLSFASGNLKVNILPMDEGKAKFEVSHNLVQRFEISISNPMGDMVYYHETEGEQAEYKKTYDFSNLEDGVYKVEVKIDGSSNEQLLSINKGNVQLGESVYKTEPFFSYKNNTLNLSYLNHNNENVSLHLYEDGKLVWEKELDNTLTVHKGLSMAKLKKGDYQIVLASGNEIYEYEFTRE